MKFKYISLTLLSLLCLQGCKRKDKNDNEHNRVVTKETAIDSLHLSAQNMRIKLGEYGHLYVTTYPLNCTNKEIEFVLSDNNIIKISNDGVITPLNVGKVEVVCIDRITYKKASCNIEIYQDGVVPDPTPIIDPTPVVDPSTKTDEFNVYCIEQTGNYGDGTLFKCGDIDILVDGGTKQSGDELKRVLKDCVRDHKIELLVSSHPHTDHYEAMYSTKNNALDDAGIEKVDYIVDSGVNDSGANSTYKSVWINKTRNYYVDKGAIYTSIQDITKDHHDDAIIKLGEDVEVQFLDTGYLYGQGYHSADNGCSVAMIVRYKNYNFFSFGDLPTTQESGILNYKTEVLYGEDDINFFKASHHGSNGANSNSLLEKINPTYAWASAGIVSKNKTTAGVNTAQHPYGSAVRRIVAKTTKDNFYWTGTTGTLNINIKDDKVTFAGFGRKAALYYYNGVIVDDQEEKNLPFYQTKWSKYNSY